MIKKTTLLAVCSLLWLLLMLTASTAWTCPFYKDCFVDIRGSLADQSDSTADSLKGAKIELMYGQGQVKTTRSDAFGDFTFKHIPTGKVLITVKAIGYLKQEKSIELPDEGVVSVAIKMLSRQAGRVLSYEKWADETSSHLLAIIQKQGYSQSKIMFVFYDQTSQCTLAMPLSLFMNQMNAKMSSAMSLRLVNRDERIAFAISEEIHAQRSHRDDFDRHTLVALGKKFGADVLVNASFHEQHDFYAVSIDGYDIAKGIQLPGLSDRGKIRRGDVSCE